MRLHDRELLVQRGRARGEGRAQSRRTGVACRRDDDQLRARRPGDEGAVDLPLIDRGERVRLARVRRGLQRELRPDRDGAAETLPTTPKATLCGFGS